MIPISVRLLIAASAMFLPPTVGDEDPGPFPAPVASQEGGGMMNWGYIDRQGKMVVEPKYFNAGGFHDGLAPVALGRVWGYIDATGKIVIEPKFNDAQSFSEGLAAVQVEPDANTIIADPSGYIDKTGKMVIAAKFQKPSPFADGVAWVVLDNRSIFIDKTGAPLPLPEKAKAAGSFRHGLGPIRRGGDVGYIDPAGKVVIEPREGLTDEGFADGLASVTTITGEMLHRVHTFVFIDSTGKTVLEPKLDFENIANHHEFFDGLAMLEYRPSGVAFIDKTGAIAFRVDVPSLREVGDFHDGLARIKVGGNIDSGRGGKCGYIDKTGKVVIEPTYDEASDFEHGLAHVQRENPQKMRYDVAYINTTGKVIWGFEP